MDIKLVITNTVKKGVLFASNGFKLLTLEETILNAEKGDILGLSVVLSKYGKYLRASPNHIESDNLDAKSVTISKLFKYLNGTRKFSGADLISNYIKHYQSWIKESGKPFLVSVDGDIEFTDNVRNLIRLHKDLFKEVGKEFNIDPCLLAAIVIDEKVRLTAFESLGDDMAVDLIGINTSVGMAQLKIDTANSLIISKYYNPSYQDKKLPIPPGEMINLKRAYLFKYVVQPKHNIRFEAAQIRRMIDFWSNFIDLSLRPEIIGTLYNQGLGKPNLEPKSIPRGDQIATEYYEYAKKWLK